MNQNQNVPQENSLLNKEILLKNPYKKLGLSLGKKKTGGRNNQGRITAYHRGGGNKLRYIYINKKTGILHSVLQNSTSVYSEEKNFGVSQDLFKNAPLAKTTNLIEKSNYQQVVFGNLSVPNYNTGEVKYLVKDPNRTSWIAGVYWSYLNKEKIKEDTSSCIVDSNEIKCLLQDNPWYSYYSNILAPEGLTVGSYVSGYKQNKHKRSNEIEVKEQGLVATVGQKSYLKDLMVGTLIHNIDGKYIRAAGCSGIIISKLPVKASFNDLNLKESDNYRVTVKLQSGQYKVFSGDTLASVGILSNGDHKTRDFRKAGQKRWLGRRPIVRGVAMNPIDHPHGGGEGKSSGGRPSVTPWGKPTKGKPTRSPKKPKLLS